MVFNQILDHLQIILNERFKSFNNVINKFKVISPKVLKDKDISNSYIREMAKDLCKIYNADFDEAIFPRELVLFRSQMIDAIEKSKTIKQLAISAFCQNSNMANIYQEVMTAYVLFLTLPVTTATPERTFSKLKLIKNYLRNSMNHDRLTDLSILSIQKEDAKNVDFSGIIDDFASVNARRTHNFH